MRENSVSCISVTWNTNNNNNTYYYEIHLSLVSITTGITDHPLTSDTWVLMINPPGVFESVSSEKYDFQKWTPTMCLNKYKLGIFFSTENKEQSGNSL